MGSGFSFTKPAKAARESSGLYSLPSAPRMSQVEETVSSVG
jgi:hypothetical protein